ncbi:MAG: hypothetical protein ACXW5U_14055 [Thermoanaerobaculia bacterium]
MPALPTTAPTSAVVEVLISSPGFSDAEHVQLSDDKAARAFARELMQFVVSGGHRRRRAKAAPPAEPQVKE